uniref:Major capsid protein n=1 Tax=Otarine gammaherpesvirus 4 TaxID=2801541 RepID=A0A889IY82_9GAMA|nr:Major capsid protein [Otarine gammaherpesvirus 4]
MRAAPQYIADTAGRHITLSSEDAMDRPSNNGIENRPYPYFHTEANLLQRVKESAAEGLFKSFEYFVGKDVRENCVRFEALLGVYTNTIQFVKFIETALAVSCLNTEFKDLHRMIDGKIQFRISLPTIAYSDGRRPNKQRQYIVMKSCSRHHINAEIELAMLDLEILNTVPDTALDLTEYVGAVKTLTAALQFGVDAMERGLIDTVLRVKLRHSPPLFILQTLANPTYTERGIKRAVKADLVTMFKNYLVQHTFFLDRAERGAGSDAAVGGRVGVAASTHYAVSMLSDLVSAVSQETVFRGVTTYTTPDGKPIAGVIITTDGVLRHLLNLVERTSDTVLGPAAYASYVVRGENVVTALSYGRAMRSFEQFMSRIVDNPTATRTVENDLDGLSDGHGDLPNTTVSATVLRIGDKLIAVESLQRMYTETQLPYPLNRRMQCSYFFPVGLHMGAPRYSTSVTVHGIESPRVQPVEAWVVNKNNITLCFGYQNALKTLCHPRIHNPTNCLHALHSANPDICEPRHYGLRSRVSNTMNLFIIVDDYYRGKNHVDVTDAARKAAMAIEDLLHPSNHRLLRLELHPCFDFYAERRPGQHPGFFASHRIISGNIPGPLAPPSFHDCRGVQLDAAASLTHVCDRTTLELIQDTAFDPAYPPLCYIVEAMVHGQEDKFLMNSPLVALLITEYWNNFNRLAFINSYPMLLYICRHLGNGTIPREAYGHYRKIYGELVTIERALRRLVGVDAVRGVDLGGFVNALLDDALLPPFAYTDIFTPLLRRMADRRPEVRIGPERYTEPASVDEFVRVRGCMEDIVNDALDIYRERINEDADRRFKLDVGVHGAGEEDANVVLSKIFYFVVLPVCTNGHVCGMGADFQNLALALAYNGPVFSDTFDGGDRMLQHLEAGTLRDIILASEVNPTVDMVRTLCTSFLTSPTITQAVRVAVMRDDTQRLGAQGETAFAEQTVLVNGFATFAIAERVRGAMETLFHVIPFHQFYCDPRVAATLSQRVAEYIARYPAQRAAEAFNVPAELMAESSEWHRPPMLRYVASCQPDTSSISAILAMHIKLSPIAFACQARTRIHPGIALTVVRTDEVLTENIMYSSRASTSVFIGQSSVSRREVRADAVGFEITHELATLETGLGYSSVIMPARAAAITTDMGVRCQDLFTVFPSEVYPNRELHEYVRQQAGVERGPALTRDPRTYIAGVADIPVGPPGLVHGQLATCEVVLTPVSADVAYFQTSNSPRGRASCVVSCDTYSPEQAEKLLYDHSFPDVAYEFRTTVNPWASQVGSLGDVLYSATYRQVAAPGMYSPCRHFFNKEDMLRNNRGLYTLVTEYAQRLAGNAATSATDMQFIVINGTDVFLDQPCLLLQEAFPALSASHRAMIDEYMSSKTTHAPVHMGHYFVEEVAPLRRLFKIGNKTVY